MVDKEKKETLAALQKKKEQELRSIYSHWERTSGKLISSRTAMAIEEVLKKGEIPPALICEAITRRSEIISEDMRMSEVNQILKLAQEWAEKGYMTAEDVWKGERKETTPELNMDETDIVSMYKSIMGSITSKEMYIIKSALADDGIPYEVLKYAISHCIKRGDEDMSEIFKTAYSWYQEGCTTVDDIKVLLAKKNSRWNAHRECQW